MCVAAIPSLNKAVSKCFEETFGKAVQQYLGLFSEASGCLKQLQKFQKLGSDTAARLATDSKGTALMTLLKQQETLQTAKQKAESMINE